MTERFELKVAQATPPHLATTGPVALVTKGPTSAHFVVTKFMLERPVPAQPVGEPKT
jgi:hypothetical protein